MTALRTGRPVRVTFLDHVEWIDNKNRRRPVRCVVYGVLQSVTSRDIVVRAWEARFRSRKDRDANSTDYTIVRAAVEKIEGLVVEPANLSG